MKPILKFAACILLAGVLFHISCKKEYSCENCGINPPGSTNKSPIANAGPDQTIMLPTDSVTLDGSASHDPDGVISSFQWSKISGPASFTINNAAATRTVVKNLTAGVYQFELKVTDNGGLSAKDTAQIIVTDPAQPNRPPVANAGADQTITLPTNNVNLDGSGSTDPDNNIISYAWSKISGPISFNITSLNAVQTQVTNLVQGTYQFELKVTDAGGLFSKDTVQVTVNTAQPNPCSVGRPAINAQLIPVTTLPSGTEGIFATIANKIYFLRVECSDCEDSSKTRAYFNIYDVVTQTWSVSRDYLMNPRGAGAIVTAGNKIFYAGGYNTDGTTYSAAFSIVDIYDASTDTWSSTSLSVGRYELAGAVVNNKVFFAGGYRRDPNIPPNYFSYILSDIVDIYDPSANTWSTAALSEARSNLSAVTIIDKIYFAGGFNGNIIPSVSNRIDVYDNTSNSWSISSLTEPKAVMASIAVDNKLFWAGGVSSFSHDNTGYSWILTPSVEIKDINTQSSVMTCLFQPNYGLDVVSKNNKIVYFGGGGYYAEKNKFDIYDLATSTWSIGVLPVNIQGASIVSINNTIYVALEGRVWKLEF